MRRFALGLLVVSGLALGCTPPEPAPVDPPAPAGDAAPTSGTTSAVIDDSSVKLVSMKVEGMTCPYSCYPKVKEAIASIEGVQSVDLAEQKSEGSIDNPIVYVKHNGSFDPSKAIAAIKEAGFEGQTIQ